MKTKKDSDPDTEHGLFARIIEDVIVFFICCGLIKLGVSYLVSVRVPLIIIAVMLVIGVIIYRICKWSNDHDDY